MVKREVVVHGKWEDDEGCICCSKCGSAVPDESAPLPDVCPYCKADMVSIKGGDT